MKCPEWQTELPVDAKCYDGWGWKLEVDCPECRKADPPQSRYGVECGRNPVKFRFPGYSSMRKDIGPLEIIDRLSSFQLLSVSGGSSP